MKRPTFLQSLAMLGLFMGLQTMISTALLLPSMLYERKLDFNLTVVAAANAISLIATVWFASLIFRMPWRSLVAVAPTPWRLAPAVALMGAGCFVLCSEVDNITRMILPMPQVFAKMFDQILDVTRNPVSAALALVIMAPLSEELLCRKWVLGSLLPRWKPWRAIAVSAAIFGAMHLNPWQFVYASLLGLSFGWIYWRTGSVGLCILAHGLNNGLAWVFGLFPPDLPGMTGAHNATPELQPLWLDAGALAVFLAGAWWLRARTTPPDWGRPYGGPPPLPTELPPVLPLPPLPGA